MRPTQFRVRRRFALAAASLIALTPLEGASAYAASSGVHSRQVLVSMRANGFNLPARSRAGWVTFTAVTDDPAGHQLEGFRTRGGASAQQVVDDIRRAVSLDPATSVAGVADTRRDAVLVGGPSADPVTPVSVTMALNAGTYWFFDFDEFFTSEQQVTLHRMDLVGPFGGHAPRASGEIVATMVDDAPRFVVAGDLTTGRTIAVRNRGDELHEVLLSRVRRGTTDDEIQDYYGSGSTDTPAWMLEPPLRGVAAMDPGRTVYVSFPQLPAGSYALLCFVPDDETSLPHVVEGMHAVVHFHR